jgi:hypothetical protein
VSVSSKDQSKRVGDVRSLASCSVGVRLFIKA